jgi:predicted RNA-binding protein with PIN domain
VARWLVDGMNVVGSRPDGWWRDRDGAARRLVGELAEFARATGEDVVVIFDGRPVDLGAPASVEVRFASRRGRDAADDDLAAAAEADPAPEDLVVVTSDAALADRVRAAGARVEGAGAFLRRLAGAAADGGSVR